MMNTTPDRTIVIGDVHGCSVELYEMVMKLAPTNRDRVVMLGDLMDRGPNPVACVRLVRERGFECVLSNHDEKHVRWRGHHYREKNGGKKNPIRFTEQQVEQNLQLTDEDIGWIASRPLSIDLGQGWFAIHAGLEANKTFEEQRNSPSLLRTRFLNDDGSAYSAKEGKAYIDPTDKPFWAERWRGPERIVYGHHIHALDFPTIHSFDGSCTVGIDTGCYAGGHLSAWTLQSNGTGGFEQVRARNVYRARLHGGT